MDEDDDLCERFVAFLHENEGGIDAPRESKRKQAVEAVRQAEAKCHRPEDEDALAHLIGRAGRT